MHGPRTHGPRVAARALAAFALLCLLAVAPQGRAQQIPETQFALQRDGDVFTVHAHALLSAAPGDVWQVLTDYDHIASFVPGISASRVIAVLAPDRDGSGKVLKVEQKGALGFALFPLEFVIELRVSEHPEEAIEIERIAGSARQYHARYEIVPQAPGQTRLAFSAVIESDRFVQPLLGTSLMRNQLSHQFEALVLEVKRRAAARGPASDAPRE